MKHHQFDASNPDHVARYNEDGPSDYGKFLLGSDGLIRFFTHREISLMEGRGSYSGATGYPVYFK